MFEKYIEKRYFFARAESKWYFYFVFPFSPRVPNAFYLYPKSDWQIEGVWFSQRPLGRHVIESVPRQLLHKAGFEGKFTLHGLRSTSATRLFVRGIPEQCIKEVCEKSLKTLLIFPL